MNKTKLLPLALMLAAFAFATPAFASTEHLNFGTQLSANECQKVGAPVVNVKQTVLNDVDSGEAGNYWAFDNLKRNIQVFATAGADVYCAEVFYQGKFDAQAGQQSPGNTAVLSGIEDGTFQGGYRATITGTLLSDPLWSTHGNVGTTDYQCDLTGNCPGYIDWVAQYFGPSYGFSLQWWGWIYRAGHNHVWVNSSDGNSGDVL